MKVNSKKVLAMACISAALMIPAAFAATPAQQINSRPALPAHYKNQNLVYTQGNASAAVTVSRLEANLMQRGIPLFAKFDHAKNATDVGLKLRPTTVLVFGAPKVGTGLMQLDQSVSLELPLRISVWEDADGHTWLAYPKLATQMAAYGLQNSPIVSKMSVLMESLVQQAAQ